MGIIEALCTAAHLCEPDKSTVEVTDDKGNTYEVEKSDLKKS